jgi:hypothetical protein
VADLGANITGTVIRCTKGSAVCYSLDEQPVSGNWSFHFSYDRTMYLAIGCLDYAVHTSGAVGGNGLAAWLPGLLLSAAGLLTAA